jgi:hypothetical protein
VFPATISLLRKRLPPRQTIFIQIRLLTDPHSTVASPDTKARIVEDGGMVDRTVVPDGCYKQNSVRFGGLVRRSVGNQRTNIEIILPPVTELRVVLFNNHLQEPVLQPAALVGSQVVDLRHVVAHGKKALPARHGVRPHYGMRSRQGRTDVVGRAARRGVQLETLFAGNRGQAGLGEGCGEGFQELAVGGGDFVVDFAGGGPDCVFSRLAHGSGL